MSEEEILNKYIDLIDKGYCSDCNELNCIDNFPRAKITHAIRKLQQENQELKKQLEEYKKLGFKHLQDKNNNLEIQQKEFIEYMNKTIEELECDDVDDEELRGYIIQRIDTFKEILSKYKEIIGVSNENNKQ